MNVALLAIFAALQAADIWTTWRLLSRGGRELNPLMAKLFYQVGLVPGLLVAKGAVLAFLLVLAHNGLLPSWLLFLACIAYVAVVIHNWQQLRA